MTQSQVDKRPDFSRGSAHVDGHIVPIADAKISLLDWGFLHSDATYDVAHVWQSSFFRLDDHIDRFEAGMRKLQLSISYDKGSLKQILNDCVAATGLKHAYVEMICTRGQPEPGSRDPRSCKNRFYAFAIPFVWIKNPEDEAGIHLIISQQQRISPASVDPRIKNYHWLDMVTGLFEAYERGGETAVLVDAEGHLVEGPGFNLFAVKENRLVTPATGVLEGITRKTVIELATELGYEVEQMRLSAEFLLDADEAFVTSTAGGVMSVARVNDETINHGETGPITQQLKQSYWTLHQRNEYRTVVDYS